MHQGFISSSNIISDTCSVHLESRVHKALLSSLSVIGQQCEPPRQTEIRRAIVSRNIGLLRSHTARMNDTEEQGRPTPRAPTRQKRTHLLPNATKCSFNDKHRQNIEKNIRIFQTTQTHSFLFNECKT